MIPRGQFQMTEHESHGRKSDEKQARCPLRRVAFYVDTTMRTEMWTEIGLLEICGIRQIFAECLNWPS